MTHDASSIYKELILELNRHPLNKKLLAEFDAEARGFNPMCGDDIIVRVKFDTAGRVADIGYNGAGCAISQAAASVVTEELKNGKTKEQIAQMGIKDVTELLGTEIVPPRIQCALLALKAIQRAISDKR